MGMPRQCAIPQDSMTSTASGTSIRVAPFLTKPDGGPSPGGPPLPRWPTPPASFRANRRSLRFIPALVKAVVEGRNGSAVRVRGHDPAAPTKGWRTARRNLTEKAGLMGLRSHDLRHSWITSHAEIGTPQSVLEAQAGHLWKTNVRPLNAHQREGRRPEWTPA